MKIRPLKFQLLVSTCAALVLSGYVTPALSQETRTLTARWLLDVERGELIENGIIIVKGDRIAAVGRQGKLAPEGERLVSLPCSPAISPRDARPGSTP